MIKQCARIKQTTLTTTMTACLIFKIETTSRVFKQQVEQSVKQTIAIIIITINEGSDPINIQPYRKASTIRNQPSISILIVRLLKLLRLLREAVFFLLYSSIYSFFSSASDEIRIIGRGAIKQSNDCYTHLSTHHICKNSFHRYIKFMMLR